jgi:hypothetical protein
MQGKSCTVHCYERRSKSTSVAFILRVSVTFVEFMWVLSFLNIGNLTDVMTTGAKKS